MSRWVEKHRYWLIGLGLFAVLILFAAGCGKKDDSSSGTKLKDPTAAVGDEESGAKSGDSTTASAKTTSPGGGMMAGPGGMGGMLPPPPGVSMMPGMGGMGGASAGATASTSSNPAEPTIPFKSVVSGASVLAVRNPDKSASKFLKFKYKTNDKLVINVVLPVEMQKQQLSRDGWNTLFQVFSTDYEAKLAQMEKDNPVVASTSTAGGGGMPGMAGGMPGMPGMPGMTMPGGLPAMPGMAGPPGM